MYTVCLAFRAGIPLLIITRFWESYRDVACTIYPVIPEKEVFQKQLQNMLDQRAFANETGIPIDPDRPYGVSMSWLALAFAMLASGAQCGTLPAKERELTSQVYSKHRVLINLSSH